MGCRDSHGLTAIQLTQPAAYDFTVSAHKIACILFQNLCIRDGPCAELYNMVVSKGGGYSLHIELFSSPPQVVNF